MFKESYLITIDWIHRGMRVMGVGAEFELLKDQWPTLFCLLCVHLYLTIQSCLDHIENLFKALPFIKFARLKGRLIFKIVIYTEEKSTKVKIVIRISYLNNR